ncbi:MAG: hypothetical protein NTU83_03395 [Candidatus Hydrogenedentes bacterium]|nr:hypothetical protein [Candidatus Hydrogenedentota bacterium]
MGMTIDALAKKVGARILVRGRARSTEIDGIYASDRMSDLLSRVSDSTLLITPLLTSSVVRMVELMDVPGICLLNDAEPGAPLLEAAREYRATLLVSPYNEDETCRRFREALGLEP